MIKVLFNSKGEASGQVGKQLASYTGVVARTFIPITINAWSDVDDQLKEKTVFELPPESKTGILQSACNKWRHFKSNLTRYHILPYRNDQQALRQPPDLYDFIELSDWQTFDNLMKEKEEGTLTRSGSNDVLSMALGIPEHAGRVRGVGGNVKPNAYFKVPRKKMECVSKVMLEQQDSLIMETRKMMAEQQKRHEAAQQALQNQIEMLKVVINTQVRNNTSLQSPNIHPSPILSKKASTNIKRKLEEGEKEICGEEGCEDVVEQTETEFMKGKECKMAFGEKANLVASGTIVEIDVPNQLVHNVPLGEGNIRVAVNCALKGDSPLPIPCEKSVRNGWGCHWIASSLASRSYCL
ncbi:hypothetical protein GBA52_014955 [Prunus armeniaca]|nr:hypothetical protein GBA52_014955 [Prunus armeniaca]